ncbi:hypothetical protein Tco_1294330 [Tanacetum coccineum]
MSTESFAKPKRALMNRLISFLKKFNRISFGKTPKVLLHAWDNFIEVKHAQPEEVQELLSKLVQDVEIISDELSDFLLIENDLFKEEEVVAQLPLLHVDFSHMIRLSLIFRLHDQFPLPIGVIFIMRMFADELAPHHYLHRDCPDVKTLSMQVDIMEQVKGCVVISQSASNEVGVQTMTSLLLRIGSGYHQKGRKPSQNDKTEHGMEKTVQNQGQSPKMPKSESILKNQQSNRSRN